MMQWYIRGSIARGVHLGLRTNRPPLTVDKFILVWNLFSLTVKPRRTGCQLLWVWAMVPIQISCHIFSLKGFILGGFFWPPYNRSNVLVSGYPPLLIPTWWGVHFSNVYLFWMCKELTVDQECIWYISCECMYVCTPRAIYASGWFSAGFPK